MAYQHKLAAFNRTALALALAFSFGSRASIAAQESEPSSPQIQTCSIMEILYQGDKAVSYRLPCQAGEWELTYTGAVPAGAGKTSTNYRLTVNHPQSGAGFTLDRRLELPSVTVLGRALFHEAALLADGDLALRDCESAGCSNYKPLGAVQRIQANKKDKSGLMRTQIEPIRATITDDRYEKPQAVQSFSPATIVAPKEKDNTAESLTVTSAIGQGSQEGKAQKKEVTPKVDTAKDSAPENGQDTTLQQENAALKVERTNLQKKVDDLTKQVEDWVLLENQRNQALLKVATQDKKSLPERVETTLGSGALSGAVGAEGKEGTVGTTAGQGASQGSHGRTNEGVGTFDLPVKTSQETRPVRAPAPSAAKAANGAKPLILPTEYYRVTPDGGKIKVYQVEAPAIVEIVAPQK